MRPRSVLVLTHELPPLGGGAGRAMLGLCAALAARGIEVEAWTQKPPSPYPPGYPFKVKAFATGRALQFQTSVPTILRFCLRALWRGLWLGARKPDLILSNTGIPTAAVGAFLSMLHGSRHVVWYHGADVHGNRREGAGWAYRLALRAAWLRADLHGFVSRGLLEMAEGYGGMRGTRMVLPLFAYTGAASSAPAAPAPEHRGQPQSGPLTGHSSLPDPSASLGSPAPQAEAGRMFLFAGRLEAVKDPYLFLSAAAWLRGSGRLPADVRFRIVGGGALYAPLRGRILAEGLSGLVSLDPPVPGESMPALYARTFALVLTSVVEGYPLTIMEAALHGVPAAGADTLGINEEIEGGATGLLFQRNAEACGRALLRLLEEEGLRDALGARAREKARGLSAERTAGLLLAALDEASG